MVFLVYFLPLLMADPRLPTCFWVSTVLDLAYGLFREVLLDSNS